MPGQPLPQLLPADMRADLRGWGCAWGVLKIKSLLKEIHPGRALEVLTDDREMADRLAAVLTGGDRLAAVHREEGFERLTIQRGGR